MNHACVTFLAAAAAMTGMTVSVSGAVLMTTQAFNPTAGPLDQFTHDDTGAPLSGRDYTDNGSPGQSFTVPGTGVVYLDAVAIKIIPSTVGSNEGPVPLTADSTWGLQIARYDNIASGGFGFREDHEPNNAPGFSQSYTDTFINGTLRQAQWESLPSAVLDPASEPVWAVFTFTGEDRLALEGGRTYAFNLHTDTGWVQIMTSGVDYAGGEAFNAWNSRSAFDDNYVRADGGDRTFHVSLSVIPEPASLSAAGLVGLLTLRRRAR